jgi:hypothetical protein
MAMTQISYGEIADQTIRSFLKAVVLIDDHWLEAQNVPVLESIDDSQLNLEPQTIPLQEGVDSTNTAQDKEISTVTTSITDPAYLREIGSEIVKQGYLFTGFAYTDTLSKTALNLASKADILILDWHLGNVDSRPALALLEELKTTSSPRFIFILTEQDLDEVRKKIIERLGEPTGGTALVFSCGPFSFSLKNKPQTGGSNCVLATQVLEEAILGIRERFGGLLQLAALELLGQYRQCLHEVLDHFHADTDLPFILEWLEKESPIRDNHSFNALAIDEWKASVTRRYPPSTAQIINNDTVSALLVNWKETIDLPDNYLEKLKESIKDEDTPFPDDKKKVEELVGSLNEWMTTCESNWPSNLEGLKKGSAWPKSTKRILSMNYLGLRKGIKSPIEKLADLDVLFQCQANLPLKLNQGTVLIDPMGIYLICITPTCDCSRPARIKNCYVFLEANLVDIATLKNHPEGSVVALRTNDNGNLLLAVNLKPTYTYKITNPSLENDIHASGTYGTETTFIAKPVAQLRAARVQSLISLAAGKSIEVGLDRSELLRQLCKSN